MTVITSLLFFHSRTFWSIPWCFSIGFLLHSRLIFMKSLTANKNEKQKKWFLNLNCTKMSSFKLCTKMILQNFSDNNIRNHSYIREVRKYCQLVFPSNGWFFLCGSLNGQNSCASLFLIAPNMPLHFLLPGSFGILRSPSLMIYMVIFFKRSWLKEFTVLSIRDAVKNVLADFVR